MTEHAVMNLSRCLDEERSAHDTTRRVLVVVQQERDILEKEMEALHRSLRSARDGHTAERAKSERYRVVIEAIRDDLGVHFASPLGIKIRAALEEKP